MCQCLYSLNVIWYINFVSFFPLGQSVRLLANVIHQLHLFSYFLFFNICIALHCLDIVCFAIYLRRLVLNEYLWFHEEWSS